MWVINMKVNIIDQDIYGNGVAKIDSIPIFVEKALPTEEVDITVYQDKKTYKRATLNSIITPSKDRMVPRCPFYDACGGCDLLHQKYESTLEYKKNKVLSNLNRIAGIKDIEVSKIISGDQYNYRNKVTLHVKDNKLGFYKKNSNDIIEINECLLLNSKLNDIIDVFRKINLNNISEIVIKISEHSGQILVLITHINSIKHTIDELIKTNLISTIIINKEDELHVVYGDGYIVEKVGEYLFNISANSFFQVNSKIANEVYKEISSYLINEKKSTLIDLYCGTGTIGISVANKVKEVVAIEEVAEAIINANDNKVLNNINNIEFILGTVELNISKINSANIVVLDPPRAGCDSKALEYIMTLKPSKIKNMAGDSAT